MEANEIGIIVHEILAKFFQRWIAGKRGRITHRNRIAAITCMEKTAGRVIKERRYDPRKNTLLEHQSELIFAGLYAQDELQQKDLEKLVLLDNDLPQGSKGILRGVIDFEAASTIPLIPKKFEYTFGLNQDYLVIACEGYPGIKIRGKIDRIDSFDSSHNKVSQLGIAGPVILEYKTGAVPAARSLEKGLTFQVPLYLMALIEDDPDSKGECAGFFYAIGNGNTIEHASAFASENIKRTKLLIEEGDRKHVNVLNSHTFQMVRQFIKTIHKNILAGSFHYSFEDTSCRACDYQGICRRDEARIEHEKKLIEYHGNNFAYYLPYKNRELFRQ
jgi:hypothetical protein